MQKIVSAVSSQIQQFANPTVTKRYKLEGTIGKGNFSQVKRATDRQTGQEVAVKVLSLATLKDKEKVCWI
jgi:serine/threonine protein kinase